VTQISIPLLSLSLPPFFFCIFELERQLKALELGSPLSVLPLYFVYLLFAGTDFRKDFCILIFLQVFLDMQGRSY
jgi:hypothetical protein